MREKLLRLSRALVRAAAWLVAAAAALALLLPVLLVLYTTTPDFRARLLEHALPELDRRMHGDLAIEGIEGSPLRALRLENVTLRWHDEEIARIPEVSVAIDWAALLFGRLRIASIEIDAPSLVLREHATLGWDWREALAPLVPAPDDPRPDRQPLPLVIERIAISDASIRVAPLDRPPIAFEGLDLKGQIDFGEKHVTIDSASLVEGESTLAASGGIEFAGRYALDVSTDSLRPRDLARVSPALADALAFLPAVRGRVSIEGDAHRADAKGELAWRDATLAFEASAPPRALRLPEATLTARLEVAELARFLPALALAGRLDATLALADAKGPFRASLRTGKGGELTAEGELSLAGTPEATLRFAAKALDPARVSPGHPEWSGSLTGRGTLAARGRDRASLEAAVDLVLEPSRVGELALDRARLRAKQAGASIELAELALASPIGSARAAGRLTTDRSGPVSLKSLVHVDDLVPLLALTRR